MPRVAQYDTRVRTEVSRGARAGSVAPGAFGGAIAQGLGQLGQGLQEMQNRIDTTAAEEALVQFEREKNDILFNPDNGYFNSQGRTAFDQADATSTALAELKDSYLTGLESDAAKQAFSRSADAHITSAGRDISRHASKGIQAWEVATLEAQVENSMENASLYWNDPQALAVQRALGRQAVLDGAEIQGITGEALNERLQTYESSFAVSTVNAATASSSVAGKTALEQYGDRLEGPDKLKAEKAIAAKEKSEKTARDSAVSVAMATNIVDQSESLTEIISAVDDIEDPDLRDKTKREAIYQWGVRERVQKEAQSNAYDQGIDFINQGGSPTEFQATNPTAWEMMDAKQRNNILNGKHMVTDQVELNRLLTLPKNQLAEIDPNDHVGSFAPADMNKLRSAVNTAKRGQSITSIQSASAKTTSAAEQFLGKKSTWGKDKKERANAFMQATQDAVQDAEEQKGGKLTPREFDEVLSGFTRQIVIEKPFFMPDTELDISEVPATEMRAMNQLIDQVGSENTKDIIAVRQHLLDNNIPVTSENLNNAYQQATR